MKRNIFSIIITAAALSACSLDYDPIDTYSEKTEGASADSASSDSAMLIFKDKAAADGQRKLLYDKLKGAQEPQYLDLLLLSESHSDNAYAGAPGSETTPFEVNSIEGSNTNLRRDWGWNGNNGYMNCIADANKLIAGIDNVPDPTLTEAMRKQYKAEAKIFRALEYFNMVRIWGRVPLITSVPPTITSENAGEIYFDYFPPQSEAIDVYKQIETDLLEALPDAPATNAADKTLFSKALANTLLAKVYAEKPLRDYDKVKQYCDAVAADGLDLVADFSDLFGVKLQNDNEAPGPKNKAIDAKARNTVESILECQYSSGAADWSSWMFGRCLEDWSYYFTWAKWITPSRDIVAAFTAEGDNVRLNESVVYYSCGWSTYYPSSNYAFMYKHRSDYNSIIKYRYADVLLLKAEALIMGDGDLAAATAIINRIRDRAKLAPVSTPATKEAAIDLLLKERRLELAFEGERWFDLVRLDKVESVLNNLHDEGRPALKYPYDANSYVLPVPQDIIDQNPSLTQNPGY